MKKEESNIFLNSLLFSNIPIPLHFLLLFKIACGHSTKLWGEGPGQGSKQGRNILVLEPAMVEDQCDQSLRRLEQQMANLSIGLERVMKQIVEMSQAFHTIEETSTSKARPAPRNFKGEATSGSVVPRLARLDFLRCDRLEDPITWTCRVEQFFDFQATPPED